LCNIDIKQGFDVAYSGGQVLGFVLVGLAIGILEILILSYKPSILGALGEEATKKDISK
jgi:Na+/H+-translocating membrane pyrophosphatase